MSAKLEGQLKRKLFAEVLRRQGAMIYPLIAGKQCPPGWPDNLLVAHKWQGLVEFKSKKRQLSMLQRSVCTDLIMRHQHVAICRLFEDDAFQLENLQGESLHEPRPWIALLDTLAEFIYYAKR